MNKTLILILVPCLVAFVVAQIGPGYYAGPVYGAPGFGIPAGGPQVNPAYRANQAYYNNGQRRAKDSRTFAYLIGGLLLVYFTNFTGTRAG